MQIFVWILLFYIYFYIFYNDKEISDDSYFSLSFYNFLVLHPWSYVKKNRSHVLIYDSP